MKDQFAQLKSDFQSSSDEITKKFELQLTKGLQDVKKDMQQLNQTFINMMDYWNETKLHRYSWHSREDSSYYQFGTWG